MKPQYERIIPMESNSCKVYAYEKNEFDTPWHYHPEYELTYILSSHGVRYVGNSFENFKEDDLVLLGPNLPHCWKNIAPQNYKASAIVFHWGSDLLGDHWMEKREFKSIHKLLHLAEKGIQFETGFAQAIKEKLLDSLQCSPFQELLSLLSVLNEMSNTSRYRLLSSDGFNDTIKTMDHERLTTIHNYVETHYGKKITLRDVAATVHLGEESFSRFFSKVMGKPFFYFLNEYRISIACKELITTNAQIVQVAYASGFESLPFFHRQFKKHKGCAPGDFRKAYQVIG